MFKLIVDRVYEQYVKELQETLDKSEKKLEAEGKADMHYATVLQIASIATFLKARGHSFKNIHEWLACYRIDWTILEKIALSVCEELKEGEGVSYDALEKQGSHKVYPYELPKLGQGDICELLAIPTSCQILIDCKPLKNNCGC